MGTGCFADLKARGLVDATTGPEVEALLDGDTGISVYSGFDPTADSLHIGHLVPLLALRRLQLSGHTPIALAGGATGLIGDPSGKSAERNLLTAEVLAHNVSCIKTQLARLLDFDAPRNPAKLVDNHDWIGKFSLLDFLRDVGKHFTVNYMTAKDSVKGRLDRDSGISFTEFSYMLLQAVDFQHLFRHHDCVLQIGGSDQWGNITAGTELIRRTTGRHAHGMTMPLITTASGQKFGKTEAGAVWLSAERTSPYLFHQYFVRADDRDAGRYLRLFTFVPLDEIAALEAELAESPDKRSAQKRLAKEVTTLIHGEDAVRSAIAGAELLYGGSPSSLTEADLLAVASEVPRTPVAGSFGERRDAIELFAAAGVTASKGEARRLLQQGGMYVNNERITDGATTVYAGQLLFDRYLLLRSGKKSYRLLEFGSKGHEESD
ncbi:MAG: tyrosine--tRNA ligase [Myxococcales bacterium]|nr:tyrosine--tRNA ligase [Myxococcales bacterium]